MKKIDQKKIHHINPRVQTRKYFSLRSKLYLLICFIVISSVGFISIRYILKSKSMLETQMTQRSLSMAEMSVKSLESHFESWQQQAIQLLKFLGSKRLDEAKIFAAGLLETNEHLVSIHIVTDIEAKKMVDTMYLVSNRIEDSDSRKKIIYEFNLDWLNKNARLQNLKTSYIIPFKKIKNASYYSIFVPAITENQIVIWACFTIQKESLGNYVGSEKQIYSFVLDEQSNFLHAQNLVFSRLKIFKTAVSGNASVGSTFIKQSDHQTYLAAYAWSDKFRFAVVYIKNVIETEQAIKAELFKTAIITLIILVIALMIGYFSAVSLTMKLGKLTGLTRIIALGDFSQRIHLNSNDEIGFLEKSINHMAGEIHRLLHFSVEAAKKEKELLTAKAVQDTFFQKDFIQSDNLFTLGTYISADECGGDWWGHLKLSDHVDMVCIADATGHGAPAALVTAIAYSFFQTYFHLLKAEDRVCQNPGFLLEKLNEVFWDAGKGKTTMTFFIGFIDKNKGIINYANAGHNFPMIFPKNPNDARLKKKSRKTMHDRYFQITKKGTPLGYEPNSQYLSDTLNLVSGDKLFLYTDGLIECKNQDNHMWGKTKMIKSLNQLVEHKVEEIVPSLIKQAFDYFGSKSIDDDITVVMVEYL